MLLALLIGAPTAAQLKSKAADVEALARQIEQVLIAPCCYTQTIAEHRSEASEQMRQEIRDMIQKGMSRQQVLDFYVAKYGERILAASRPKGFNLTAYILPGLGIVAGAGIVALLLRRWKSPLSPTPAPDKEVDADYLARIERELEEKR